MNMRRDDEPPPVNPFTPAVQAERYVKMLVHSDPGVGKTWFALGSPGKRALVDLEGGSYHYEPSRGIAPYDRICTKRLDEIDAAVTYIEQVPDAYDVLVIDPITVIWEVLQDAMMAVVVKRNERKRGRRGHKDPDDLALTPREWGTIKRRFKSLMTRLMNLRAHVILCARSKDVIKVKGTNEFEVVGTRPDSDKQTAYWPDVVGEMYYDDKGRRVFYVDKDRTGLHQQGQKIVDPTFDMWLAVKKEGAYIPQHTEDEAAKANAPGMDDSGEHKALKDSDKAKPRWVDQIIAYAGKQDVPEPALVQLCGDVLPDDWTVGHIKLIRAGLDDGTLQELVRAKAEPPPPADDDPDLDQL